MGITRAQENLTLSCVRKRMIRGEVQYNKISRFLKEVPRHLMEAGGNIITDEFTFRDKTKPAYFARSVHAFDTKPFYTSNATKSFGVKSDVKLDYEVGDRVRHMKFGEGLVTGIVEGGRDYEVTVEFDNVGPKKMFATFAKLQKV